MIKKTITYTDFNGNEQTEDFYFNLTKAELAEMELSGEGNSLKASIDRIVKANDGAKIVAEFKRIFEKSYGVRSADGKHFIKSKEEWDKFSSGEAYSTLFMELATDADKAIEFINALVPSGLSNQNAPQQAAPRDGFRPGYDPNYRPTPPVAGAPQPIQQSPDQSQAAPPIQQSPQIPPQQPYPPAS